MRKSFTNQQLWELRNLIPIRMLIEEQLHVPNRMTGNVFRFQCPVCFNFHTGIMTEKNLARCFDCSMNFNTIEIVMRTQNIEFLESADFLHNLLESCRTHRGVENTTSENFNKTPCMPDAIDIIPKNAVVLNCEPEKNRKAPGGSKVNNLTCRVEKLETEIRHLKYQLSQLKKFTTEIVADMAQKERFKI